MAKTGRTRSEGWRHAKVDGHANENSFGEQLITDTYFLQALSDSILENLPNGIPTINVDGSKHVKSILEDQTTSKVDLEIVWPKGERVTISLKKSNSGQVWLISVQRFMAAISHHLEKDFDEDVAAGISLFIGGSSLAPYQSMYEAALKVDHKVRPKIAKQESHQKRLLAESISATYPDIWEKTLEFFSENIELITKLSFAEGLAADSKEFAQVVVYNKAPKGANVFPISSLVESVKEFIEASPVVPGPRNGGSTLLLPTGTLQMHHPQDDNLMQFRHEYKKIVTLDSRA
jgi:hypothetical protein